jgi:hypothetical protein
MYLTVFHVERSGSMMWGLLLAWRAWWDP